MILSIVTTLYYSQDFLLEFYQRACAAAERVADSFEIILVNDGSPDRSLELAIGLAESDPRVRVIDLSRNFGQHRAIMTGLAHARGELVFLLDVDLEEQPELLGRFFAHLRSTGADVVFGVQEQRRGGPFERWSGELFYRLFNALSNVSIPPNLIHARLMTRRYVESLVQHRERNVYIAGLMALTGFHQEALPVCKGSRGSSSYNLGRRLHLMLNGITSFSEKPLYFILYLGAFLLVLSILAGLFALLQSAVSGSLPALGTLLLLSIWLLGGLAILCIGIVAVYLSTVVVETKDRPYTIVRRIYEQTYPAEVHKLYDPRVASEPNLPNPELAVNA